MPAGASGGLPDSGADFPSTAGVDTGMDIIVPVYAGEEETFRCLESVIRTVSPLTTRVLVINDHSPEPALNRRLAGYCRDHADLVDYTVNPRNLGFAGTVNAGMSRHPDRDVILLNSDTVVSGDWVARLVRHARSAPDIGTVSPLSNNAAICSFPLSCADNPLPDGLSEEEIDAAAARVNAGRAVSAPTTVGFCMLIRRACLNQVGFFDEETFGRGYGEENDFCMRAGAFGWRHVLAADVFVRHDGGVSFGAEQHPRQIAALKLMQRRHPAYQRQVYRHIADDPAREDRLALRIECVRTSPLPKILMVTHGMGGGIEQHVGELCDLHDGRFIPAVLRFAENGALCLRFGADLRGDALHFPPLTDGTARHPLIHLLRYTGVSRIHFHWVGEGGRSLMTLPGRTGLPYDITLHDYDLTTDDASGMISPILTDAGGVFHPPKPAAPNSRALAFLRRADRVISPSRAAADLFCFWAGGPEILPGLRIIPHPDGERDTPYPPVKIPVRGPAPSAGKRPLRIVVLGALSREKGADLLDACARDAVRRKRPLRFHLIGFAWRRLHRAVRCTGPYENDDLQELIEKNNPDLIWFPARCPETWSYTLSAALNSGWPVAASDTGAFPERLAGRPLSWVNPLAWGPDQWNTFFETIPAEMDQAARDHHLSGRGAAAIPWPDQAGPSSDPAFYRKTYLAGAAHGTGFSPETLSFPRAISGDWAAEKLKRYTVRKPMVSRKEKILIILNRVRIHPVFGRFTDWIPHRVQRAVKRWFSRRPLHEIQGGR